MFEKIVLRCSEDGSPITVGRFAEALLFYQNVHLVLDRGSVLELARKLGLDEFIEVLSRPNVSAVYVEEMLGTFSEQSGMFSRHAFTAMKLMGDEKNKNLRSKVDRLEWLLRTHTHISRSAANKFAKRFFDTVPLRKLSDDYFVHGGVVKAARNDIRDPTFVLSAVAAAFPLAVQVPFRQRPFEFKIVEDVAEDGPFFIWHDIDFEAINALRKAAGLDEITPALFTTHILTARADTILAAHYGGDFVTSETSSAILRIRHAELLQRASIHAREIQQFEEIVLADCPSVREVIDGGERTFGEFLKLLARSDRFRKLVHQVGPDQKLVAEYVREITQEDWINRLPAKTLRYIVQLAVGSVADKSIQVALSLADAFLVDKLLGGWRANHFVERRLKPFVVKEPCRTQDE